MKRPLETFVICFLVLKLSSADLFLSVNLLSFTAGSGYLYNGVDHCDPFYFAGRKCNIRLQICVDDIKSATSADDFNSCSTAFIDLGQVTDNDNSITFANKWYGAWLNPSLFRFADPFQGFQLKLIAEHFTGTEYKLIDKFAVSSRDSSSTGALYNQTGQLPSDNNFLSLAWVVAGNASSGPTTTTPAPKIMYNCRDYYDNGHTDDGVFTITLPDNSTTVQVYCDLTNGGWTVIQSRSINNDADFNVTYDAYKARIGNPGLSTNFWLGLDAMNNLTMGGSTKYSIRIELCCRTSSTSETYEQFQVGPVDDGYRLTVSTTAKDGTAGDGFNAVVFNTLKDNGQKFSTGSTWQSNFPTAAACATYGRNGYGGWWFGSCQNNLNGYIYPEGDSAYSDQANCQLTANSPKGQGVVWDGLTLSKTKARMKIIPEGKIPTLFNEEEQEKQAAAYCSS